MKARFVMLLSAVLPLWARCLVLAAAGACLFLFGQLRGERIAGQVHTDYLVAQAAAGTALAQKEIQVVVQTETKYRDRVQTVYVQGAEIEKQIPVLVTPADTLVFGVNAGFVRLYDAAWEGSPTGPPADTDREPAAVSLADVASADAHNAISCRAWREKALGLRENYQRLQGIINGNE
jgi:hypothetical protein